MAEVIEPISGAVTAPKRRVLLLDVLIRLVKEKPLGTVGAIVVLVMLFAGIFAEFIAPYGMNEIHMWARLSPSSAQFILGTDSLGRDMLSRVIFGARISMIVGLAGSFLAVGISTIIGILSGFLGGKIDIIVQRFVDAVMCFPGLLLIITVMSILGPGLLQVILVLGLLYGIYGSRVIRSAVISIKENIYVEASTAIGCTTARILMRHILPNIMAPIIILLTVRMGSVILSEAAISFLGYGIPPPQPSWGGMLSGLGRKYMLQAPWMALWPGAALSVAVFGINMLGDAVRDILDPRLRGGLGRYGRLKGKQRGKNPK